MLTLTLFLVLAILVQLFIAISFAREAVKAGPIYFRIKASLLALLFGSVAMLLLWLYASDQ